MKSGFPNPNQKSGPNARQERGRRGEDIAAAFLVAKGFRIREKNWRTRFGEIDLIAEREGEIRFVEVKMRYGRQYGYPEESVTPGKQQRFFQTVEMWLQSHTHPKKYQADVIAILIEPGKEPDIKWFEGID